MDAISDNAMSIIEYGLRGAVARQNAHSQNLANVSTPQYKAKIVEFETILKDAIDHGDDASEIRGINRYTSPAYSNGQGNNVDLTDEMTKLLKTSLLHDGLVNSYTNKTRMFRRALGG